MQSPRQGLVFAILSPLLSGISTVFGSGAVKIFSPIIFLTGTSFIGSFCLFLQLIIQRESFGYKKLLGHKKEFISIIVIRQMIGLPLFAYGLLYTDAIKVMFFTKVEPYFVLLWLFLLKREKITRGHVFLLTVHIAGAIVLSTGGNLEGFGKAQIGDLLIVLAMGATSFSYASATKLAHDVGPRQVNAFMLLITGFIFLPFAFFTSNTLDLTNIKGWIYVASYAIIFSSVALTMWFASLRSMKGWMVSALRALSPVFGAPFAYFLLSETLTPTQLIGGIIVLATSFIMAKEHLKDARKLQIK